jgi:hypothetical protein
VPATREAIAETNAWRRDLLALRRRAVDASVAAWALIATDDVDEGFRQWLEVVAATITAAQLAGLTRTGGYLERFLTLELGRPEPIPAVDLERATVARDGRTLEEALRPAVYTVKAALAARHPNPLAVGARRAHRTVAVEAMSGPRDALDQLINEHPRIVGWRRATTGNPCGACLAAATGAIQESRTVLRVHSHCRCVKEPVVGRVRERFRRPTGAELWTQLTPDQQDALFEGTGGKDKADLIRSGEARLEDLITPQPMVTVPDEITETPLAALRRLAERERAAGLPDNADPGRRTTPTEDTTNAPPTPDPVPAVRR